MEVGIRPTHAELTAATTHLKTQRQHFGQQEQNNAPDLLALASLCHVLINANEFIYID